MYDGRTRHTLGKYLVGVTIAILLAGLGTLGNAVGSPQIDGLSSREPEYDVREDESVMVPMQDGVQLSTDLYFPDGVEELLPTILVRTPYNKNGTYPYGGMLAKFVSKGYAVAVQDARGRFESEGRYTARYSDRNDGHDTVTWLSEQPWSDQKVATFGCSYLGETQLTLAATRHPNHVAAIPMAPSAAYYAPGRPWSSFNGGAFELAQTAGWFLGSGSKVFYGPPPWVDRQEWFKSDAAKLFRTGPERDRGDYLSLYWTLPVVDIVKKSGLANTDYDDYASNAPEAPYFQEMDFIRADDRFDVPALYIDSWYDCCVAETLQVFNQMRAKAVSANARDNQYVIIAPSTHCAWTRASEQTIVGERDLGDARRGYVDLYLDWYDYWLKGKQNGATDMPRVQYYLMGKNEWRSSDVWPLAGTEYRKFYLHSGGRANSRYGDGKLSLTAPGEQPADEFVYDPATPVMSLGGQACCTGMETGAGSYDQSTNEMRNDVLVYSSEVLQEGLDVTGPLKVVLYVSSSAKDTDFTAKLVDVYPDGKAYNIQEGARRMRYRESLVTPVWVEKGKVYEISLDLHVTSNYFGPGHRIRLEISSSNFPRFDRNLNTGGNNYDEAEWQVAANTVHHSAEHRSHIVLPVIPLP